MSGIQVSVIIPAYNSGHCLGRALDSVLNQDCAVSFEVIVVDDGSTDNTRAVVDEISHRSPHPVRCFSQENAGPGAARTRGVREARGVYVCFVDADDIVYPGSLDCRVKFLESHPEAAMVFGDYDLSVPGKDVVKNVLAKRKFLEHLIGHYQPCSKDSVLFSGDAYQRFFERPPFPVWTNTVMVRRADFPGFREDVFVGEDLDCWWRLLRKAPAGYINQSLALYFHASDSITGNRVRYYRDSIRVFEGMRMAENGKCRKLLTRLVAQHYFELGYIWYQQDNPSQSLSALRQCLRYQWFHPKAYKVALVVSLKMLACTK